MGTVSTLACGQGFYHLRSDACQTAAAQQSPPSVRIDLEQAIQMAVAHNHSLKAARTQIPQSEAQEITAALRPNPVFTYDDLYVPIFNPGQFSANYLDSTTEFDLGISYMFERGHKRQARIQAAKDQTSVTRSQVSDTERGLTFNVAQQFVAILLAKSTLQFANQDLASYQQTVNLSSEQYRAGAISEGDLLKIKLQLLQFQMDVSASPVEPGAGLREPAGAARVRCDSGGIRRGGRPRLRTLEAQSRGPATQGAATAAGLRGGATRA